MSCDPGMALLRARPGGTAAVAARLGLRRQSVWEWARVPQHRVLQVSEICDIPAERLRPDLADWIAQERCAKAERRALLVGACQRTLADVRDVGAERYHDGGQIALAACRFVAEARGLTFAGVLEGESKAEQAARALALALAHVAGRASSASIALVFRTTRQNVDNASERYMRARDGDDPDDFVTTGADGKPRVIERGRPRRAKEADEELWTLETAFAAQLAGEAAA